MAGLLSKVGLQVNDTSEKVGLAPRRAALCAALGYAWE